MNAFVSQSVMQLLVWGTGLVQLILALYILVLNTHHPANRHASGVFFLFALSSLAMGAMIGAENIAEGTLPAIILATTTPAASTALMLTAISLVKLEWLTGRGRWFWRVLYLLSFAPLIATFLSVLTNIEIWFIGLPENYTGGYIQLANYTAPELTGVRLFYLIGVALFLTLLLVYFSFFDKKATPQGRKLARILLVAQIGASAVQMGLSSILRQPLPIVISNTIFFLVYAYATFSQALSERRLQRGRLQTRLTAVILVIAIPLLIFTPTLLFNSTSAQTRQNSVDRLRQTSVSVAANVDTWLNLNSKALEQLVSQPGVITMEATIQKPMLESMDDVYPYMYLVSTTDPTGLNIARSDDNKLADYSDRAWFQEAVSGAKVAFQTLIGRTSGEPAIVISKPILSHNGNIVGVGMFASNLNSIGTDISNIKIGETGTVFVVDAENLVVAHTNPTYANQLLDFSLHPAVVTMRNLDQDSLRYRDQYGTTWVAYFQKLENGWGVVAEQDESELLAGLFSVQIITTTSLILGGLLLSALTWLAIRQAVQPLNSLTETATAIAQGDLTRVAPVESEDEIGFLAQTFNQMTEQLLDSIGGLEQRVSERTKDLETRSKQLEATTEVGWVTSSILDVDELIQTSVQLIQERFELYYVGLFLVDQPREYAVLRAGTGEAGKAMLARQHMIRIGEGMIGWAVENGQSRVAAEAGADAVRLATKELPETRSEAAIPLRSRGQVIGAISVQSSLSGAFDESTMAVLQTMADLVSVAIDNARLYTETETALKSTQRAYSELSHEDWLEILQKRPDLSFRSDRNGVQPATDIWTPEMRKAWVQETTVSPTNDTGAENIYPLAVPIKVRGNVIGVIQTHKTDQSGNWTEPEKEMLEAIIEQIGVALDSARLYEETQIQANNERIIGEVSTQMRETLDVESVLQTAARELRSVLNLAEVEIRMGNNPAQVNTENQDKQNG